MRIDALRKWKTVCALVAAVALLGCVPLTTKESEKSANMEYNPNLSAKANAVIKKQGLNPADIIKTDDNCYFEVSEGNFEAIIVQLYDFENDRSVCD